MRDHLGRDLGLYAVFTISVGAMIGSGIFVLPGLAASIAGPAVVLAYLLAGLVVLPAALSKAEMATAMPRAGGTYLFIDRALGPGIGTVAGLGAWFSLVFKSAFALVGLGAYLVLFVEGAPVDLVALGLGAALIVLNVLGARQVGRLQAVVVTLVLTVLIGFVASGAIMVDHVRFVPFLPGGLDGLLATTGFVFVAYAGVTKIASIAEEVDDPGRTLPLGMFLSIGVMMVVYTAVTFVIVGVTGLEELSASSTPMALAARQFLGPVGAIVISVTAVLALTSMANAGILSASRYPFAMGRDRLLPDLLRGIHPRFGTPVAAIVITGATVLLLIVFVPVMELAKLASAFQLLVFAIVNLAVIVFRESDPAHYRPTFRSPLYPWVQIAGIVATLVLIPFMGTIALSGALGITLAGTLWYLVYGRSRTRREGAAVDALRGRADQRNLNEVDEAMRQPMPRRVVVPVAPDLPVDRLASLLQLASDLAAPVEARLQVLRLVEVPVQSTLDAGAVRARAREAEWDEVLAAVPVRTDAEVRQEELVSHDSKRALVNYVRSEGADLVLAERSPLPRHTRLLGDEAAWLIRHLPCDAVFVENRGYRGADTVVAVGGRGPLDPATVRTADRLALRRNGNVRILRAIGRRGSPHRLAASEGYQGALRDMFGSTSVTTTVFRSAHPLRALVREAADADVAVLDAHAPLGPNLPLRSSPASRLARRLGCTVLIVHARVAPGRTRLGAWLDRLIG